MFSIDAAVTLTGDLKMSGGEKKLQITHKEESLIRTGWDREDCQSLHRTLLTWISPMDPDSYVTGSLLNIRSGQIAQPNVTADRAVHTGAEQLINFEKS